MSIYDGIETLRPNRIITKINKYIKTGVHDWYYLLIWINGYHINFDRWNDHHNNDIGVRPSPRELQWIIGLCSHSRKHADPIQLRRVDAPEVEEFKPVINAWNIGMYGQVDDNQQPVNPVEMAPNWEPMPAAVAHAREERRRRGMDLDLNRWVEAVAWGRDGNR